MVVTNLCVPSPLFRKHTHKSCCQHTCTEPVTELRVSPPPIFSRYTMNHRHPITTCGSKTSQLGMAAPLPPSAGTDSHREKAPRPRAGLAGGSPAAPYLPLGSRPGRAVLTEAERPRVATAAAGEASRTVPALVRRPRVSAGLPSPPLPARLGCLSCDRNRPSLVGLLLIFFFFLLFIYLLVLSLLSLLLPWQHCTSVPQFSASLTCHCWNKKREQNHTGAFSCYVVND